MIKQQSYIDIPSEAGVANGNSCLAQNKKNLNPEDLRVKFCLKTYP